LESSSLVFSSRHTSLSARSGCDTAGEVRDRQGSAASGRGDLRGGKMFDDQDLGFFANFLGIFIFVLVIAYHFVMADPKYEGN
ncbi:unnamed protein product, partial [Urochloa humidicola]